MLVIGGSGFYEDMHRARGSLYRLTSTPPHDCQEMVPLIANVTARRMPLPVFGAGLIEAIDDFLAHHGHLLDTAPEEAPVDVWPAAAGATT